MQRIEDISAANFAVAVRRGSVLVHFAMHGCAHCEKQESLINNMAHRGVFPETVKLARLYIDHSPLIAEKYDVEKIPALILFQDGTEILRHIGSTDEEKLLNLLAGSLVNS